MTQETITFDRALKSYIEKLQAYSDNEFQTQYPKTWASGQQPKYEVQYLQKWVKIVKRDPASGSVFCFIDPNTGDIYKPASFKVPAKGIRGNIYNEKLPLTSGSLYRV